MAGLVEFYLTGIWGYRDDGVKRIITQLRSQEIPDTDFTFDPESNWFKVICREGDVSCIQSAFRKAQSDIEADVDIEDLKDCDGRLRAEIVDNKWIQAIQDQLLAPSPSKASKSYRCPEAFARYPASRVWLRIEEEAEPGMTLGALLWEGELGAIAQPPEALISHSLCQRIIYIGAASQDAVDCIARKLDTLFDYSRSKPPRSSHLLYGEAASSYTVDARYMAHINPNLVTSTVFDPGRLWARDLETQYRALYSSVSLRICLHDAFKGVCLSLFGPRTQPCFTSRPHWWSSLFHKWDYAPKAREDKASSTLSCQGGELEVMDKMDQVATWVAGIKDTNTTPDGATKSQQPSRTIMAVATSSSDVDECTKSTPTRGSSCSNARALCPMPERALIHSNITDGLVADSPDKTRKTLDEMVQPEQRPIHEKLEPDTLPGSSPSYPRQQPLRPHGGSRERGVSLLVPQAPASEEVSVPQPAGDKITSPLISAMSDSPRCGRHGNDGLHTQPTVGGTTSHVSLEMTPLAPASLPRKKKTTKQSKVVQDSQTREDLGAKFLADLHTNLAELTGAMRVKVGTVRLRAEIGRICLMDPVPGGLAFNTIEEAANGWNPTTLASKLNAGCNSASSMAFARIISTIGNDADYLVNQTNDVGDRMWSVLEKRVWYDFTCRRTIVDAAGCPKGSREFVVEIEGSRPDNFSYKISQHKEDTHILWAHCLQRHWDVRFVLAYVPQARLEASYGAFAKALLCSLVIPPDTKHVPRLRFDCDTSIREDRGVRWNDDVIALRVRHVARHVGRGGETYLDITHVRDMRLAHPTRGEGQIAALVEATPAEGNMSQGKFASWYEASVTSARGEKLFAENETMSLGEEASWTPAALDREGVFQAIYEPALEMVKIMDGVGVTVDNGQDSRMEHPPRTMAVVKAERAAKGSGYLFW